MTRKKIKETGPSSVIEWIAGTSVESALRYRDKQSKLKASKRDRIFIELSTDDESETDTLKVTYPRSGGRRDGNAKSKAKAEHIEDSRKVRFDDRKKPLKSALKKTTTTTVEEVQTDEETDSDGGDKRTKKKGKKNTESSEDESEEEVDCPCEDCVRAKQKAKKQKQPVQCLKKLKAHKKQTASEESEESGSDVAVKQGKDKKVKKGKKAESDSEPGTSDEEADSELDTGKKNKNVNNKCKQNDGKKQKNQPQEEKSTEEKPARPLTKKEKKQLKKDNKAAANNPKDKIDEAGNAHKKGSYPEGMPGPHPRRPNYIEPVRAEVVQTERVMEGPEDPKPNAYYDAEHNVIRVYHGPVYGNNHSQGLYPKRDPSGRVLPLGAPHPSQNPYFNGFQHGPPDSGAANIPVTQGMPVNAMYAHGPGLSGYPPPLYYGGPPPPPPPGNKGAFAQFNGAGEPGDKNSATNNVGPGSNKGASQEGKDNPYYKLATANVPNRSKFSNWGSDQGSRKNDKGKDPAPWGSHGNNSNKGDNNAWGNNSDNGGNNNAWGNNSNNGVNNWVNTSNRSWSGPNIDITNHNNLDGMPAQLSGAGDSWPMDSSRDTNPRQNDGADSWGNDNNNTAADDWGNITQTNNTNSWDVNGATNDWAAPQASPQKTTSAMEENNVAPVQTMPGAWDSAPAWGDPTAAAATGGAVDNEVDDGLPLAGW